MKTFKYFDEVTSQDALNPLFPYGGSSYGPGMGQYEPIADLNADAKKKVKKSDLDQIERYADRIFAAVGIDVEFTRHFLTELMMQEMSNKSPLLNSHVCSNNHSKNMEKRYQNLVMMHRLLSMI